MKKIKNIVIFGVAFLVLFTLIGSGKSFANSHCTEEKHSISHETHKPEDISHRKTHAEEFLNKWVGKCNITREKADELLGRLDNLECRIKNGLSLKCAGNALSERLNHLVEEGRISKEKADEILSRLSSVRETHEIEDIRKWSKDRLKDRLDKRVEDGVITREKADELFQMIEEELETHYSHHDKKNDDCDGFHNK